jgi:putative transposase
MRKPYPTDLSDDEWNYIEPHMPPPLGHGRPRIHSLREILNAIFYVLRSGCQWRLLPHDFPRWPTVYHYFRKWRIEKAPGRRSIGPSENAYGFASREILSPALA